MAGLLREVWTGELLKAFRQEATFLTGIPNYSSKVVGGKTKSIHLVDVGADPAVLVNNTTYPIATSQRTDGDVAIGLHKFETENTTVTDDEMEGVAYDKIKSVNPQFVEHSSSQIKIKDEHHKFGLTIKYFILIGIVASAFYSFTLAEVLSEVEPFKTSITLYFVRYWPFALYAVALLLLSMKVHKVYCRYLCPLGAGLAVLGRFPIFKLLRRRSECGSPCQLCRQRKCDIDAINKDYGNRSYHETLLAEVITVISDITSTINIRGLCPS